MYVSFIGSLTQVILMVVHRACSKDPSEVFPVYLRLGARPQIVD